MRRLSLIIVFLICISGAYKANMEAGVPQWAGELIQMVPVLAVDIGTMGATAATYPATQTAILERTAAANAASSAAAMADDMATAVCFVEGTMVRSANGLIPIESICAGMLVASHNPETGETGLKEVVRTFVRETKETLTIRVDSREIVTTPEHPFWVEGHGWTAAKDLTSGDKLLLESGKVAEIVQTFHQRLLKPQRVYNFEVDDWHTYYVSDLSVLVHNACTVAGSGETVTVYRGGDITVRPIDVKLDANGNVLPLRGVSVNVDPSKVSKFGNPQEILSMPNNLQVVQRGGAGHYEIIPTTAMSMEQYQQLLSQIVFR
jgi:hypothetical protein